MDLSIFHDPGIADDDPNRSELDSHADTCVAGSNTVPLSFTDHKVVVSPFISEHAPLPDVPVASVATAWDDPKDGSTIILVVSEAFYFGERMPHSLLCPNQLRDNGIIVHDCPKYYDNTSSHSITVPCSDGDIELPLQMRGTISYLDTRKPTEEELLQCPRYELTSAAPWNPSLLLGSDLGDSFCEVHALTSAKTSDFDF
jgi:hypothetical protein